ncbi:MAG: isochorismatase family protein [Planctomycetaceae bacterium]
MYQNTDEYAQSQLELLFQGTAEYYALRGIFQGKFQFGEKPAIVVIDFAYGWTDESYAGGSKRLDDPVQNTAKLLNAARPLQIPIIFTTSPFRPQTGDQPFKSAADRSEGFRPWDARAVELDARLSPQPSDYVIEKENASAFFGTHLASYLIQHKVDTVLLTGCSTSACVRATATDAKSYRFKPIVISDCVGDRVAALHAFTLFDLQSRFADVVTLKQTLEYLQRPAKQ